MATLDQLRSLFPDAQSDSDVIKQAATEFGIPVADIANEVGYGPKGGLTRQQFSASADQYQAGLYGVGEAVTGALGASSASKWLKKRREENELEADLAAQRARDLGAVDQWKDVHGVGDFGSYAKGLAIQSLPYAAEALVGGALGRGAMAGTRAALAGAKTVEEATAAKRALDVGSLAGATAASYPSSVGDILQNQREQTNGETNLGAAAALGIPYAALNALGETGLLAKGALPRNPVNMLDSVSGVKGAVARAGTALLKTGAEESLGETGQEIVNQMGRMAVDKTATLTDPEALERYKESAIGGFALGGLMGGATGWRRSTPTASGSSDGGDIQQAVTQKDTTQPDILTSQFNVDQVVNSPVVQPPAVSGGSTEIAQAQQAAQQQAAQQQAQADQAATRAKALQDFKVAAPDATQGQFLGKPIFGPIIAQVGDAIAPLDAALDPHQRAITQAVITANEETGGKLISFSFNANNPQASVQKGFEAIAKAANKFQIAHVQSVEEAAQILDAQSQTAKKGELDQINAIHFALTGKDTSGYIAAQQTQAEKGAKNDKLQLQQQTPAGLGEVPVQSGTGETSTGGNGPVRPADVQPVGATSVGAGPLNIQAGQPSAGGVRPSPSASADIGISEPSGPGQGQGQVNAQPATETTAAAETPAVGAAAPRSEPVAPSGEILEGAAEATLDNVPALVRNILRMVFPKAGEGRIELYAAFMSQKAGHNAQQETYEELGKRYGLKASTVKDYVNKDLKLGKSGFPLFIERDADKFRAALDYQAKQMGVSVDELFTALETTLEQDIAASEAAGIVDEVDMIVNGMAIQNRAERTGKEGEKLGKSDLTNTVDLVDETDYQDRASQAYLTELDAYAEDPSEVNKARLDAAERAASAKTNNAAEKLYRAYQIIKEGKNAVQEQSTREVDVRQQPSNGETVGEGNAKPESPAGEGKQAEAKAEEPKQEEVKAVEPTIKTPEEQWAELAATTPGMPDYASLNKDQKIRWDDLAHRGVANLAAASKIVSGVPDETQQSRKRKEPAGKYTKEELESSVKDFMNRGELGENVNIVDELEDIRTLDEFDTMSDAEYNAFLDKEGIDNDTQAFVSKKTGRVYMLAANIERGTGRGVFLHEVGSHLGLQKYLSPETFNRLAERVIAWAKADDGSLESKLARIAASRVSEAEDAALGSGKSMSRLSKRQELVAYFLEEAVNAGINPRAYEKIQSAGMREWMRSLWAAFKAALRNFRNFNAEKLTGQDLVDMAYGYAQLETNALFHGTNNKFRKFQLSYMGSGVGNQQYGWGLYFAELRPTAEGFSVPEVGAPKNTKSYVHAVDIAVRDHELLDWSKSINDQSAKVQALAGKLNIKGMTNGENLYKGLAEALYLNETGEEIASPVARAKGYELASKFLDARGIKGIKYRDSNDASRKANNIVVFNDANVVRIQTDIGTALDRQAMNPDFAWEGTQQSRRSMTSGLSETLPSAITKPAKSVVTNLLTSAKHGLLAAGITEDIVNMAGKYMSSAKDYLAAQYARQRTRLDFEMKIESILDAFDRLPKELQGEGANSVNRFILDSTMSKKWGFYPGEHRIGTTLFEVDPELAKRFVAFPKDAQQVIRAVFEHGYTALKAKQEAIDAAVEREFAERTKAAEGDADLMDEVAQAKKAMRTQLSRIQNVDFTTPYAYLGRYGDYVVAAKSKEFKHWEERAKLNDFDKEQAKGWLAKNVSNPDHYVVQFAETQGEADQIAKDLMATGLYDMDGSEAGPKEDIGSYIGSDVHLAVARLRNLITRQGGEDSEGSAELNRMISDLYLMTAAENSARKSEIMRKYVSGANANMMRNLATSGRADAHFLSTMKHNDDVIDSLERMRQEAKGNVRDAMPFYNELFKRQTNSLDYKSPSPLSRALTQATSVWFLSTSPAFYLQQALQTTVLSLPFMAGRLGYFRSVRAIKGAYNDVAGLVKGLRINEHIDFSKAPEDVRTMLQTLVGMGKIDIGIDADAKARAGEHGPLDTVMRKLQGVNNRIEAVNRATAAIAAYRGYIQRYGVANTEAATKFAADVVSNTHGSYDGFNTPRILNSDTGRLVGQFKRFQIIQLSMLGKLIHGAFKDANPEERLVARRALAFITGHMAVLGGALGVPFVQQVGNLLLKAFGDDDEPKDLEYTLRQAVGDETMANLLLNGVPAALGVNLSGKLGMGNVASILPFTDVDLSKRSGYEKVAVGMMGPFFGGLAPKLIDGAGMIGKGEYYKGLELLLPNGVGNAMKGVRYANEGVTMRNGDLVLKPEEISLVDAAFQAVGLPTTTITGRQYAQKVTAEFNTFYADRANEIKGAYVKASRASDAEGMAEARKDWEDLQASRRKNGFKIQPMSELFKASVAARKREAGVVEGVEASKNNKEFVKNII